MFVDYAFLERNDRVVRDRDAFGTNLRAALGDVAVSNSVRFAKLVSPILYVERMHLERGSVHEKARSDKSVELLVIAKNVADILAEIALDAFPEFLNAIDV